MLDLQMIGKKIQKYRKFNNMSQDELALNLLVSRQAISRWEMGLSSPSIDNLIELTKLFQISFEELLCLEDEVEVDPLDIFKGHDRRFIIKEICNKRLDLKLSEVFYQLSTSERRQVLLSMKNNNEIIDNDLLVKLTEEEKKLLNGEVK